jgi:hypothetical protein
MTTLSAETLEILPRTPFSVLSFLAALAAPARLITNNADNTIMQNFTGYSPWPHERPFKHALCPFNVYRPVLLVKSSQGAL